MKALEGIYASARFCFRSITGLARLSRWIIVAALLLAPVISAEVRSAPDEVGIGIFCNGKGGLENELKWTLKRNGVDIPGQPGIKMFNYEYVLNEDQAGKYRLSFTSYWQFKLFAYTRKYSGEKWQFYQKFGPATDTDRDGRSYYHVDFDISAPRLGSMELLVQVPPPDPYDPQFAMVSRVFSANCTTASFGITGCQHPESIVSGGKAGNLTCAFSGNLQFPVTMIYRPKGSWRPPFGNFQTVSHVFRSRTTNPLEFPGALYCSGIHNVFLDYEVLLVDANGVKTRPLSASFTCK